MVGPDAGVSRASLRPTAPGHRNPFEAATDSGYAHWRVCRLDRLPAFAAPARGEPRACAANLA